MPQLLSAQNLSLVINEEQHILSNVNLDINQGETIGIIGKSGSGKTMFSRVIADLLIFDGFKIQGSLNFFTPEHSINLLEASPKEKAKEIVIAQIDTLLTDKLPDSTVNVYKDKAIEIITRNTDMSVDSILDKIKNPFKLKKKIKGF